MFDRSIKLTLSLRIFLLLLLATFLSLLFPTNSYAQETIKIVVGLDKTGPLAFFGDNIHHALEIATDDINSKGGVIGKKVELVMLDTQSKSAPNE